MNNKVEKLLKRTVFCYFVIFYAINFGFCNKKLDLNNYFLAPKTRRTFKSNSKSTSENISLTLFKKLKDLEILLKIEKSIQILQGYSNYSYAKGEKVNFLNTKGLSLLQKLQIYPNHLELIRQDVDTIFYLLEKTPTIKNPGTELFIPVFEGFTKQQIQSLGCVWSGASNISWLTLQLSNFCSNNCQICGAFCEHSKAKIKQLPYPMVYKILKNFYNAGLSNYQDSFGLMPYYESEPGDYFDSILNATINDVIDSAKKIGFDQFSIISHGSSIINNDTKYKVNKISLHLFHHDIIELARETYQLKAQKIKDNLQVEELEEKYYLIIDKYFHRFLDLFANTLTESNNVKIKIMTLADEHKKILEENNDEEALFIINFVTETLYHIIDNINDEYHLNLPKKGNSNILWVGKAVKFLSESGVSDKVIEKIQNTILPKSFTPNADSHVDSDGRIIMITPEEDGFRKFVKLKHLLPSFEKDKFKKLLAFLKIALQTETFVIMDENVSSLSTYKKDSKIKDFLKIIDNKKIQPMTNITIISILNLEQNYLTFLKNHLLSNLSININEIDISIFEHEDKLKLLLFLLV